MKVDINNVNEVAQDVVGQQLVNDASEVGYSVSERIQLLIKQSQALSEELAQLIEQAGNDTSILLGQEENINKINKNLSVTKEKINDLISTKESDVSQQMSELMARITALQNRTLGTQIKDEVRSNVNSIIDAAKLTITQSSEKFKEFFKSVRDFSNRAIDKLKENAERVVEVVKDYRDSLKIVYDTTISIYNHNIGNDYNITKQNRFNRDAQKNIDDSYFSYMIADRTKELEKLQEKYDQSSGIEKLMYKLSINRVETILHLINKTENINQKINNYGTIVDKKCDGCIEKITDLANDIRYTTIAIKEDLKKSSNELRDKTVLSAIEKLEKVSSKVKSYAENKGIDLSDPDKKKELDDFDLEK